jgi:hypothetical protein
LSEEDNTGAESSVTFDGEPGRADENKKAEKKEKAAVEEEGG